MSRPATALDRVRRARKAQDAAQAAYRAAVATAHAEGVSAAEIAATAGVSRQAVYAVLRRGLDGQRASR